MQESFSDTATIQPLQEPIATIFFFFILAMAPSGSPLSSLSAAIAPFGSSNSSASSSISALQEHDYMGLGGTSSSLLHEQHQQQQFQKQSMAHENVEDADLRLGLGPPVPRKEALAERYGMKRGYAEAVMADIRSPRLPAFENFPGPSSNSSMPSRHVGWIAPKAQQAGCLATYLPLHIYPALLGTQQVHMSRKPSTPQQETEDDAPSKSQVVGWPPVRSFRMTTLAANPKSAAAVDDVDSKADPQTSFYVKVNTDGLPVGRKVDLGSYNNYEDLANALIEMFQLPANGQRGSWCHTSWSNDPSRPFNFHNDFSLTYEDKDGDWMLVGDVPWRIFLNTVCRLRIMKNSQGIGSVPMEAERCRR